jgi:hypothetical protein
MDARVSRAEDALYAEEARRAFCATHALGDLLPDPKDPADQFAGGCHECGRPMPWNVEGCAPRWRAVMVELYGVGSSLATITASRRSCALMEWLRRRAREVPSRPPLRGLARALDEESLSRFVELWREHLKSVPDELLEFMADELQAMTDAELEAIIWPSVQINVAAEGGRQLNVA